MPPYQSMRDDRTVCQSDDRRTRSMIDAIHYSSRRSWMRTVIATTALLIGCGSDHGGPTEPPTPVVATVQVTGSADTVGVADTVTYSAIALTSTGKPVVGIRFNWTSSDTTIARVDPQGHAIFLAPGTAVITANAFGPAVNVPESVAGTRTLTVKNFITTVALALVTGTDTAAMGDTIRFAAVAHNGSGAVVDGAQFSWSVSDTSIARVDQSGLVSAAAMGVVDVIALATGPSGLVRPGTASQSTPLHVRLVLKSISSGGSQHVCGVAVGGIVYCWGKEAWGQLGDGIGDLLSIAATPVRVHSSDRFTSVSAAFPNDARGGHTCGITSAGALDCWGSGIYGMLGTGSHGEGLPPYFVSTPLQVAVGPFSAVAGDATTTCALTTGGDTYCAGSNYKHQLGVDTVTEVCGLDSPGTPVPESCSTKFIRVTAAPSFKSIVQGGGTTCGLTGGGNAWCWGDNWSGAAGVGYDTPVASAAPVVGGIAFAILSVGGRNSCGITSDGTTYCWGYNLFGGIGNGTSTIEPIIVPTRVSSSGFSSISVGASHACALTAAGDAYCWGLDQHGELGAPSTDVCGPPYNGVVAACSPHPVQVQNVPKFVAITAGSNFTCGLTNQGAAYCWGTSQDGELGNGTSGSDSATPVRVKDVP